MAELTDFWKVKGFQIGCEAEEGSHHMIRERFGNVRAELVQIDDKLFGEVCAYERETADNKATAGVSAVVDALRSVISILLRVIDSLP